MSLESHPASVIVSVSAFLAVCELDQTYLADMKATAYGKSDIETVIDEQRYTILQKLSASKIHTFV